MSLKIAAGLTSFFRHFTDAGIDRRISTKGRERDEKNDGDKFQSGRA